MGPCWGYLPDSDTRPTIVNLSWPKGRSVNSGVQYNKYLSLDFVLNYPSVDDIVKRVSELRPRSLLCKVDISRAFRQLKVDPGDINLPGLKLDSYYILINRYHFGTGMARFSLKK